MKRPDRGSILRLAAAVILPVIAAVLQQVFWSTIQPSKYLLFYPAVFLASWIGGLSGGLVATFLSAFLVQLLFAPPYFSFEIRDPAILLSVGVFTVMGVLFSVVHEQLKRTTKRASEQRYRRTLDSMMEGCQIIDREWRYVYVNEAAATQGQSTREALIGKTMMEAYPGIEKTPLFDILRRCQEKQVSERIENKFNLPDGGVGYFELSIQPVPEGMFILSIDTTERKRTEQALREMELRLRTVLTNAPVTIFATDVHGVFTLSEGKGLARVGLKPGENVGASAIDLFGSIPFVEDTGKETTGKDIILRALAGETVTALNELRDVCFDNQIGPLRASDGKITGVVGIATDITDRKRAEEETKRRSEDLSLLNALNAAANRGDNLGTIISILVEQTKRLFSSTGVSVYLTSEDRQQLIMQNLSIRDDHVNWIEQLIGMKIPQVRIALTQQSIYHRIWRKGRPELTNDPDTIQKMMMEFTQSRALQELVPAIAAFLEIQSVITAPMFSGDELVGMLDVSRKTPFTETDLQRIEIIAADLSSIIHRKRSEEELWVTKNRLTNLSHRLLETQENERRAVARELHDEVGQILTALKIDLQVIRRDQASHDFAVRLDDNIAMLNECLQRVRDLSLDLRPSILDDLGIVAALRWQLERLQQRAGFQGHLTVEHIPERCEPNVETACFRVAREALTNIAKHAKAHIVEMNLAFSNEELILSIHDDGIGFDSGMVLEEVARGKSFGILGMQERIALLGGKFEISSSVGKGTSIGVRLPSRVSRKQ
jgi:PAS domain S-box-containing protein